MNMNDANKAIDLLTVRCKMTSLLQSNNDPDRRDLVKWNASKEAARLVWQSSGILDFRIEEDMQSIEIFPSHDAMNEKTALAWKHVYIEGDVYMLEFLEEFQRCAEAGVKLALERR